MGSVCLLLQTAARAAALLTCTRPVTHPTSIKFAAQRLSLAFSISSPTPLHHLQISQASDLLLFLSANLH